MRMHFERSSHWAPHDDGPELSEAELAEYAAWASEAVVVDPTEPYPREIQLDSLALQQKGILDSEIQSLHTKLTSEAVLRAGYYNPGGGAAAVAEMRSVQADLLPQIYADVRLETPYSRRHARQETPTWCQLACVSNALTALGQSPVSQVDIAAAKSVPRDGRPFPGEMRAFLADVGLHTEDIGSVSGLMDALLVGDKAVVNLGYPTYPVQHAVLVSGLRIGYGDITFLVNDPSQEYVQDMSLGRMLQLLEPPLAHNLLHRSFIVSARNERSADKL